MMATILMVMVVVLFVLQRQVGLVQVMQQTASLVSQFAEKQKMAFGVEVLPATMVRQ